MPANNSPAVDIAALRAPLADILREAGALALTTFKLAALKSWLKEQSSPVSEADIAVNNLLRTRLSALQPDAAWLSEETEDDLSRTDASTVWIVDPIDGTRAYIAGREDWCISVGLARNGRPVLAALYAPVTDEMFVAAAGAGATCNDEPMQVNAAATFDGARIAAPQGAINRFTAVWPTFAAQPKVHSLALRFVRVAHGRFDVAIASDNSNDWDLAAADLLLHEAGGLLTDFSGRQLAYNRAMTKHPALVGAGPARSAAIIDVVRDWKAR